MNSPLRIGLIAGLLTLLIIAGIEASLANTENDFFQFCTTRAYGWPVPWKIDSCLCDGGQTTYPVASRIVNIGVALGGGLFSSVFFGSGAALILRKPHVETDTP